MDEGNKDSKVVEELSKLFVKFDLSLDGHTDWLFYLWIIQTKLERKPPTPLIRHYVDIIGVRNNPKFRDCYKAFCEMWDFIINVVKEEPIIFNNKKMEDRYLL